MSVSLKFRIIALSVLDEGGEKSGPALMAAMEQRGLRTSIHDFYSSMNVLEGYVEKTLRQDPDKERAYFSITPVGSRQKRELVIASNNPAFRNLV